MIVDGHHHMLAAEQEGKPTVCAYVVRVDPATGPRDELHSLQERNESVAEAET